MKKICTVLLSVCICSVAAAQEYETPPVLSARVVLPKATIAGKNLPYTIDDRVLNDGYLYKYTIRSKYGVSEIRGTYFLYKSIQEIQALLYIEKNFPSGKVAATAVGDTAKGIVTAPIKVTKKVFDTVTDTEKLSKTARAIPGGIVNLFGIAAGAVSDLGSFAVNSGKSAIHGESSDEESHFDT